MSLMKLSELMKDAIMVEGNFSDLSKFDFYGVYILSIDDDIKYIGSAYAQKIKTRLNQYISVSDTGGKSLRKKVDKTDPAKAIVEIKKWKITAIHNDDLEYKLISISRPIHNIKGKSLVKDEEVSPPSVDFK